MANGQRAQSFKNTLSYGNLAAVQLQGTGKKQAVLQKVKEIVQAGITDLYGDESESKYIYIVDLIIKRVEDLLDSLNISQSFSDM